MHRPNGSVIKRRDSGGRLYYIRSYLGCTRTIIDATGGMEQTYDYYPSMQLMVPLNDRSQLVLQLLQLRADFPTKKYSELK
jgi:hypothetical protein